MAADSWILEQAKEELEILETQHPNRFDYLKLELKSFICDLQATLSSSPPHPSQSLLSSATTQVSSNRKRRCSHIRENGVVSVKPGKRFRSLDSSKDRVDVAIERAEACLRKIREIKQSFFKDPQLL